MSSLIEAGKKQDVDAIVAILKAHRYEQHIIKKALVIETAGMVADASGLHSNEKLGMELLKFLEDADETTVESAVRALKRLGGSHFDRAILAKLSSPLEQVKITLGRVLWFVQNAEKLEDTPISSHLMEMLQSGDPARVKDARLIISSIGTPRALSLFVSAQLSVDEELPASTPPSEKVTDNSEKHPPPAQFSISENKKEVTDINALEKNVSLTADRTGLEQSKDTHLMSEGSSEKILSSPGKEVSPGDADKTFPAPKQHRARTGPFKSHPPEHEGRPFIVIGETIRPRVSPIAGALIVLGAAILSLFFMLLPYFKNNNNERSEATFFWKDSSNIQSGQTYKSTHSPAYTSSTEVEDGGTRKNTGNWREKVEILIHENRFREALDFLSSIASGENPPGEPLLLAVSGTLFGAGDPLRARDILEKNTLKSKDSRLLAALDSLRASIRFRMGDIDGALQSIEKMLVTMSDNPGALAARGYLLLKKGDYSQAHETFRRIEAIEPESSLAIFGKGLLFLEEQRYEESRKLLETLLKTSEVDIHIIEATGQELEKRGKFEEASRFYEKLAIISTGTDLSMESREDFFPSLLLAHSYTLSGNHESALSIIEKIHLKAPELLEPVIEAGFIAYRNRDYAGARKILEYVLDKAPGASRARLILASILIECGMPDKAIALYRELLQDSSFYEEACTGLSSALIILEKDEEAEKAIREGLTKFPDSRALLVNLAVAQFNLGRENDCLETLSRLNRLGPHPQYIQPLIKNLVNLLDE